MPEPLDPGTSWAWGEDELNMMLFCVVEMVKVDGLDTATGLLFVIFKP